MSHRETFSTVMRRCPAIQLRDHCRGLRSALQALGCRNSTTRTVAAAKAVGGKRTRYSISGTPGLFLDCLPSGERNWYARYQVGHGGHRRKERFYRLGSFVPRSVDYLTLAQAKERCHDVRGDARKNQKDRFADERAVPTGDTFDALFSRWLERHAKVNKKSWREDEQLYGRHIEDRLGGRVPSSMRRCDFIDVLDSIADDVSGIQANRCQSLICAVLNWSVGEEYIDANPAAGIKKRGKELQRDRVLTEAELRSFWYALSNEKQDDAIRLLLMLGQRREEQSRAIGAELSADCWNIPGSRTKNGRPHSVPLTPYARKLFGDGFDIHPSTLTHRVGEIARELGIADFRLHDLRHCAATGMAKLGVPSELRARIQNQITGMNRGMQAVYDQYEYLEEKRAALARWEREVLRIVEK